MDDPTRPILGGVALALAALIALAAAVGNTGQPAVASDRGELSAAAASADAAAGDQAQQSQPTQQDRARVQRRAHLPNGVRRIFGNDRTLVAYYGTAGTGALGVLGETNPDTMVKRVRRAAAPFRRAHSPVQVVFELIVTIADRTAGPGRDYNHGIRARDVRRYIRAAHRHHALLLLDLQPGRSGFLTVAKRWAWALRDPYVGLALDPEWRLGRNGVPGQRIGSVDAREVNRTSAWLRDLVARHHLPQKLFVLHQFRTDMIQRIDAIRPRRGLVMVQHVDGFGTPGQKLDTFHTVARPRHFRMGFKLFYDEDVHRMRPGQVRAIRPRVRFVSYQ